VQKKQQQMQLEQCLHHHQKKQRQMQLEQCLHHHQCPGLRAQARMVQVVL
jgi:hypothetical protein